MPSDGRDSYPEDASPSGAAHWALEATTDNVILLDREFRITFINRGTAALNGITQESVLGKTIWEQWPGNLGTDIERNYRHAMETGEAVRFVHGYFDPGKFDLWLEIHAYPSPDGLAIFFHDVSDAKREAARQAADQERLASAMRATDLGFWRCNLPLDDHPFDWSPQVRRHFGISDDERVGVKEFLELLHPEDRGMTADAMARAIGERVPYDVVYRTIGRDGKMRWIRATGNAFYREDGTPYRFDGFTVELTERVETERELRETQRRVQATLAAAEIGTYVFDPATALIHADANVAAMFGMRPEEADRSPAEAFVARIHPDFQGAVGEAFALASGNGLPFAAEYRIGEREPAHWVMARGYPERDEDGVMIRMPGVIVDITAQKAAQARERTALEAVQASERQQRLRVELVDALRDLKDSSEISAKASEVVGRFFGASRAYYVDVDPQNERFEVLQGWCDGVPMLVGVFDYEAFGRGLLEEIARGATVAVEDTERHRLTQDRYAMAFRPAQLRSFLVVPRLREGRLYGMLALNDHVARVWSEDERTLLEELAGRVWDAIERARAVAALRASEERFRAAQETMPDPFTILEAVRDENGEVVDFRWTFVNEATGRLTGEAKEQLLGALVSERRQGIRETALYRAWLQTLATGEPFSVETFMEFPSGRTFLRLSGVRVGDGVAVSFTDLTQRRLNEERLEEAVSDRTSQLQAAVKEAEGFNYSIAHDLRTPLRAMVSTSSILLEEAGESLGEDHRSLLVRQAENAKRLGRLIDELLRLSRLARAEVHRERLDMSELFRSVFADLEEQNRPNGCAMDVQEGMTAQGDAGLVRTVLHNLVGNACKFSPKGGTIRVREEGGVFSVSDEGVGFEMQFAPKIFLPFERLVPESAFEGTGIGLANVERIVRRHGGRVWAESEPGKGSTFSFTLG